MVFNNLVCSPGVAWLFLFVALPVWLVMPGSMSVAAPSAFVGGVWCCSLFLCALSGLSCLVSCLWPFPILGPEVEGDACLWSKWRCIIIGVVCLGVVILALSPWALFLKELSHRALSKGCFSHGVANLGVVQMGVVQLALTRMVLSGPVIGAPMLLRGLFHLHGFCFVQLYADTPKGEDSKKCVGLVLVDFSSV